MNIQFNPARTNYNAKNTHAPAKNVGFSHVEINGQKIREIFGEVRTENFISTMKPLMPEIKKAARGKELEISAQKIDRDKYIVINAIAQKSLKLKSQIDGQTHEKISATGNYMLQMGEFVNVLVERVKQVVTLAQSNLNKDIDNVMLENPGRYHSKTADKLTALGSRVRKPKTQA